MESKPSACYGLIMFRSKWIVLVSGSDHYTCLPAPETGASELGTGSGHVSTATPHSKAVSSFEWSKEPCSCV